MDITMRYEEGVTILELKGRLTIGGGDVELREKVEEALRDGAKNILLNLQGIKTIDSSGLGELLRFRSLAEKAGAIIKLVHVHEAVADVLEITRLVGVFEIYDHELSGVASFRDDPPVGQPGEDEY